MRTEFYGVKGESFPETSMHCLDRFSTDKSAADIRLIRHNDHKKATALERSHRFGHAGKQAKFPQRQGSVRLALTNI
jgi:hypothetical protein